MILQDFYDGKAFDAYSFFGAHPENGGIMFRTYAPNAESVEVEGEFNGWNGEFMSAHEKSGVYSLLVPNAQAGQMYKYRIHQKDGITTERSDPYGFMTELRPNSASIVVNMKKFRFTDKKWMQSRTKNYDVPMNIYEMHMGSWKTLETDGDEPYPVEECWLSYREVAKPLIEYVKKHGFTHIEVLPLAEHPADCSWGYQVTGFFSPTSRYGAPDDLKYFVNECHKAGIGVITDFVPVHFAVDGFSLAKFDGKALYEYPEDNDSSCSQWGSYNFNYYRGDVCSFMQSAANYWLTEYHFDGIRMDAISNALYWQGNSARGVNNGSLGFIRRMNDVLHKLHPTAVLMAEDSSNFLKVTAPVEYDGLGFDYKWDMGWMNDTLDFFRTPPNERPRHYHKITFSMQYFYNELFLLPFSHDEVVHGKATIIQKMWGDYDVKFPQCRALYTYMYTHPGKKLNFMGNEFAQFREWDETREQDWFMFKYPAHDSFCRYVTELAQLYLTTPALNCGEYDMRNFRWLEADAPEDCVYAYQRFAGGDCKEKSIIVVLNLSDRKYTDYIVGTDRLCTVRELIYSDTDIYGGNTPSHEAKPVSTSEKRYKKHSFSFTTDLAPFSAKVFEVTDGTALPEKVSAKK